MSSNKQILTLLVPPTVQEKLLDVLLEAVGEDVLISVPTFRHGGPQARLSNLEQVMGRSAALQIQVLLTSEAMGALLQRLREELRGTGLRYWASALTDEGEIE